MLVKCICTNCAGHLEFEETNAGESIVCPHCGFKTTLFLPGAAEADAELVSLIRRQVWRRRLIWATGAVLVFGGLVFALYHWGVPWLQDYDPAIDTTGKAVFVLVLLCLVTPFALGWLVFPVILFLQLRRIITILEETSARPEPEPINVGTPEHAARYFRSEMVKYAQLVKKAGIELQ